jgi:hypothetical protein
MEMALRQMQIDEGVSDISMSQQKLNRAQVRATLHQMRGEAMSQGVRTNAFGDARIVRKLERLAKSENVRA